MTFYQFSLVQHDHCVSFIQLHLLGSSAATLGPKWYWGPALLRQPPHQLLAAKLNEPHYKPDERNHKGCDAENQHHYVIRIQIYHLLSHRKLR